MHDFVRALTPATLRRKLGLGKVKSVAVASLVTVVLSACSSARASPSGAAMGEFDGVWTGSTAQGQPASFTISNRTITAITVPYDFNGCSGVKSFSNLSVGISQSSGLMPVQVNYTSGPFGGPDQTSVFFVIYPDAAAINVTASFFNYSGCGNATTFFTAFKGSPPNYSGHWSGSTSQGAPIAFVVASLKIQSITLGFNFGACAGTTTYPDLALPIAAVGSRVGFSYTSGPPELPNHALIIGYFDSSTAADGVAVFTGYPGCANQTATWTATAVPGAIGAGSTQLPTKRSGRRRGIVHAPPIGQWRTSREAVEAPALVSASNGVPGGAVTAGLRAQLRPK